MLYAPTGAGKTHISSKIIADCLSKNRRILFLVHRTKLIEQTISTLVKSYGVKLEQIGVIAPNYKPDYKCPVQISMVQTIQNRQYPEDIGLLIVDEAHTTAYFSVFEKLLNHYSGGIWTQSKCFVLGLSASPWRTKKREGFCRFFQAMVRAPYPEELIKQGHLCSARHFGWGGLIDYSKLDVGAAGDFTQNSLEVVCNSEYNKVIIDKFLELCPTRKTIAFCAGVKQSIDLSEQFNSAGIKASVVTGETPEFVRKDIYNQFKRGDIQVISSVSVLCEGFDETSCNAAIIARPTKSRALLVQMCGRALRLHPDKQDAYLLDFGDNFKRLGLPVSKFPTPLCPTFKKAEEMPVKECPNCSAILPIFAMICPDCGYLFVKEEEEDTPDTLPEFGEIFSKEQQEQISYLRGQLLRAYKAERDIGRVTWLFTERYNFLPPQHWYLDAIFRRGRNVHPTVRKTDEQALLRFFKKTKPTANSGWLGEQFRREFGKGYYDFDVINWKDVLGVPEHSNYSYKDVTDLYRQKIVQASPEDASLLNFCLEEALKILNSSAY